MEVLTSGVRKFYRSIYEIVAHAKEYGLVIYGAGYWGKVSYDIFRKFDLTPVFFCDDDMTKQGTTFENTGIEIVALDKAIEAYPKAVYFAAVTSGGGIHAPRATMNRKLQEKGVLSAFSGFHPIRYLFLLDDAKDVLEQEQSLSRDAFVPEQLENMIIFNHMSNSGSAYFGTLMDGHPNVLNIPMFGNLVLIKDLFEQRLRYLEDEELVLEITSQMTPYLKTSFDETVFENVMPRIAARFFLNESGQPEERIYIDCREFIKSLSAILMHKGTVSFSYMMKAIYASYYNAIDQKCDNKQRYWIFFMRHKENYDMTELDELISKEDFKRLEYWFIIREPIQHWFSWLKRFVLEERKDALWYVGRPGQYIGRLCCDLGIMLEKKEENKDKVVKIVRFEDVKKQTERTMQAVCEWMEIPYDSCMTETTTNGIVVYFPAANLSKSVISSKDTTAVDRKDFSSLLTSYDILRLNLVFANFKNTYGYGSDVPDYKEFSEDFWKELWEQPFRFEQYLNEAGHIAKETGYLGADERETCHEYIVELFMNYIKKDRPSLFDEVLSPKEGVE